MGYIVFAAGVPHAPGLAGLFDAAPPHVQDIVRDLYDTLARRLREARPDVLIVFANDHLANSRVRTYPDFLIGMAPEHSGPFEWFKEWIDCRDYTVPGNPEVAEALLRGLGRRGHRMFAERANLKFDDNISVPTVLTDLDRSGISLVPVLQNCTVPPMPDQNACYATGKALRSVIEEDLDPGLRVALLGSGGLSHEPGGSRYYFIDEAFDRWFLELAASGDHARLLRELTLKRMQQSGAGGTCELLAWVVVMGAIGACRGQASGYAIHTDFKCGIGGVFWDLTTETLSSAEATVSPPDRSKANCTPSGGQRSTRSDKREGHIRPQPGGPRPGAGPEMGSGAARALRHSRGQGAGPLSAAPG